MRHLTLLLLCLLAAPAGAQDPYPAKPIRVIDGSAFLAGQESYVFRNLIAPRLGEALKQRVIVDYKGAEGITAAEVIAKAEPDGYTLLFTSNAPMTINTAKFAGLPYSPARDFEPIVMVSYIPMVMTVSAAGPIRSVADLIAHAKAHPGKTTYGSSDVTFRLAAELFKRKTGTDLVHVPFENSRESLQAVIAGQATLGLSEVYPAMGPVRGGILRAIAVTSLQRKPYLPDVPTLDELGFTNMNMYLWTGLFAPARTSVSVLTRLNVELNRVLRLAEVREGLSHQGVEVAGGGSFPLSRIMREEIERWSSVAKEAGIEK